MWGRSVLASIPKQAERRGLHVFGSELEKDTLLSFPAHTLQCTCSCLMWSVDMPVVVYAMGFCGEMSG